MLALASAKHSLLASSTSAGLMAGLDTETRLRHNICQGRQSRIRGEDGKGRSSGGEESYQQRVHRAEVLAGVKVSVQDVLHRLVFTQSLHQQIQTLLDFCLGLDYTGKFIPAAGTALINTLISPNQLQRSWTDQVTNLWWWSGSTFKRGPNLSHFRFTQRSSDNRTNRTSLFW